MQFDWSLLGTVLGGGATALLTRFLGITQRISSLERRLDTQAELIANLTSENSLLRQKVTEQDEVIRRQGRHIGQLTRQNAEQAQQLTTAESERAQQAVELAELRAMRQAIYSGHSTQPSMPPPKTR